MSLILVCLLWIIQVSVFIGTGVICWNWVDPESFSGALGFLLAWAILEKIAYTLIGIVFGGIVSMFED